jgi:outer membrane protein assembly factor BamB
MMSMRGTLSAVVAVVAAARAAAAAPVDAPDDFGVACVEASSGEARWRSAVEAGWPARVRIDETFLWEDHGAGWVKRDLATGSTRGHGTPPDAVPAPETGFWTTTDAIVHDQDGETGTVVRTGAFVDDLAIAGEVAVFSLDRDDGQIYGWDLGSARVRWQLRPRDHVPGFEAGDGSRVELLGGRLLVHAPPALMSVDPESGAVAWVARVPQLAGRWGPLRAIEAAGRWVIAVDGAVVALDPATGEVAWVADAGAGGATALVTGAGAVCFDRRDEVAEPYTPDEAEVARTFAFTVEGGELAGVRWVRRAEFPEGSFRVLMFFL